MKTLKECIISIIAFCLITTFSCNNKSGNSKDIIGSWPIKKIQINTDTTVCNLSNLKLEQIISLSVISKDSILSQINDSLKIKPDTLVISDSIISLTNHCLNGGELSYKYNMKNINNNKYIIDIHNNPSFNQAYIEISGGDLTIALGCTKFIASKK